LKKNFYNLLGDSDFKEAVNRMAEFYSNGGFRENLNDQLPNLVGTYFAIKFIIDFGNENNLINI